MITLGGIASVFLAVKLFNKISMRWMLFADLQQASIDSTYGAQEAAVFLFGKRIMQHSGMMGLGLGATNSLNRVYKTLKNDYIIEKIVIEMGNMTLAVVLVLLAALVFSMLKLPAVNLFDEVLNLAIVMTICATCMLSAASALNCMPPVGVPFLGLSEGNSLFLAFGVLLGVNDGIKRRALKNEKICDQQ